MNKYRVSISATKFVNDPSPVGAIGQILPKLPRQAKAPDVRAYRHNAKGSVVLVDFTLHMSSKNATNLFSDAQALTSKLGECGIRVHPVPIVQG